MRIVSVEEMRHLEQRADAGGNSFGDMMETAGRLVAQAIVDRCPVGGASLVVLAGPGNNGGDGLVAARHLLLAGWKVYVHLARERSENDPVWSQLRGLGVAYGVGVGDEALTALRRHLAESGLVLDALFGTGAHPPVSGEVRVILDQLGQALSDRSDLRPDLVSPGRPGVSDRPLVIAVDVPSGLNADTGAVDELTPAADVTVTMGLPKLGLLTFPGAERVGELIVAEIGLPEPEVGGPTLMDGRLVSRLLPSRPRDAHKGTFGSALIVAGSTSYSGAALLAAGAAARTGCGLVTLAGVGPVVALADSMVPEATRLYLPADMGVVSGEAVAVLRRHWDKYEAMLVGPGLTTEKPVAQFLERLLGSGDVNERRGIGFRAGTAPSVADDAWPVAATVFDADALNLMAQTPALLERLPPNSVLTPHPGEMARLLSGEVAEVQADRIGAAVEGARRWKAVVVLKGAFTVIADPGGEAAVAPFAGANLATAGTGDVLAGAIVSLLAQGLGPYEAACAAVYLHGLAGELAGRDRGRAGVVASDVIVALPRAQEMVRGW